MADTTTPKRGRRPIGAALIASLLAALVQLVAASPASAELPTPAVTVLGPITYDNQSAIEVQWSPPLAQGQLARVVVDDADPSTPSLHWFSFQPTGQSTNMTDLAQGTITVSVHYEVEETGERGPAGVGSTEKNTVPAPPTLVVTNPIDETNHTYVQVSGTGDPGSIVQVSFTDSRGNFQLQGVPVQNGSYVISYDLSYMVKGPITASAKALRRDWVDGPYSESEPTVVTVQKLNDPVTPPVPDNLLQPTIDALNTVVRNLVCALQGALGQPCPAAARTALRH